MASHHLTTVRECVCVGSTANRFEQQRKYKNVVISRLWRR